MGQRHEAAQSGLRKGERHPITEYDVSSNGIALRVIDEGVGDPVVFVHGFPELAYSWRHQVPAIAAAGLRAIAYDLRGYGGSSKPQAIGEYGLETVVDDLVGLLDALDIEAASLVGHDWGSIIVWTTAVLHPDRVARIVSLNVPYRGWCCGFPTTEFIAEHLRDRFEYVLRFQEPGVSEAFFEQDLAGRLSQTYRGIALDDDFMSDAEFAVYHKAFRAGGMTGPLNYYRNIDANWKAVKPHADALIGQKTLMIAADADPVLPVELTNGMGRWIADLRVEVVKGSGHWTQQEQPEVINRLLVAFLG